MYAPAQTILELTQPLQFMQLYIPKQRQVNIHTVVVLHVQLHIKRILLPLLVTVSTFKLS